MALDFPSNPTNGQVFGNWQWDGTKWITVPLPTSINQVPIVYFFAGMPATSGPRIGVSTPVRLSIPTNFAGTTFATNPNTLPTAIAQFNSWTTIAGVTASNGYVRLNPDRSITGLFTAVTLNPGDSLALQPPPTQDATLADVAISILTTRV